MFQPNRRATAWLVAVSLLFSIPGWAEVRIVLPSEPVPSNDRFEWRIPIRVVNELDAGLYADSLVCEIEDLDPGQIHASRHHVITTRDIGKEMRALSRFDSTIIHYSNIAIAERARLTFHLHTHTAEGEVKVSHGTIETRPGAVPTSLRSVLLEDKNGRIETVLVPEPWPYRKSPGILLVHGEGSHARRFMALAWHLANRGATVMLVSQPGYGLSGGTRDFAGPKTVHALSVALDRLRRIESVDSTKIAVWGISRGATAAALLATERRDLTALILQSGIYDLKTAFRDTRDDSLRLQLKSEAGGSGGWGHRSALRLASRIHARVLFLHGEADPYAPSNQAVDLAAKLRAAGRDVQLQLFPGAEHALPSALTSPQAEPYLERHIGMKK